MTEKWVEKPHRYVCAQSPNSIAYIVRIPPAVVLNGQQQTFVSWEIHSNASNMPPLSGVVCLDSNKFDQMVP